ncbi:succinate dehydrogenase [ubiquinone] cytochrome b small subunit A, mitochondrial-like [Symsagittifera roscoffensis]|uniref:succinate dehydrogenase [ubiquinone] cytochrome b small subunit A, mitochondrial-like n=1 Tax=Symsagittifera roscoffensis TaxID=84072 RepID=UPI00307B85E5
MALLHLLNRSILRQHEVVSASSKLFSTTSKSFKLTPACCQPTSSYVHQQNRKISVTPDTALKYLEKDKHSHTKEWLWERGTAIGLLSCFPAAFILPFPLVDFTLTTLAVFHGHLGMEAVFTDYAHSHALRKAVNTLLYAVSFFMWGALMYFNYADVGLCGAVKLIWTS